MGVHRVYGVMGNVAILSELYLSNMLKVKIKDVIVLPIYIYMCVYVPYFMICQFLTVVCHRKVYKSL